MFIILVLAIQSLTDNNDRIMHLQPVTPETPSPVSERRVLSHAPLIALGGAALHTYGLGTIKSIEFNEGFIGVDPDQTEFSEAVLPVVILSTLGFDIYDTARITHKAPSTAMTQIKHLLMRMRNESFYPENKTCFTRYCLTTGIYKLDPERPGKQLGLTNRDREVVQALSYGEASESVARKMHLSVTTVRTHEKLAAKRSGLHKRERLILGAFLSGEIKL